MRRLAVFPLVVLLALVGPIAARAEDPPADPTADPAGSGATPADPGLDPDAPGGAAPMLHGKLELSIRDAVEMGLKNNLDVEVARYDPPIFWEDFRAAWGAYDPLAFGDLAWNSIETPVATQLQTSNQLIERTLTADLGLAGKLPWVNATYGVTYTGDRLKTTSSINSLSPEFTTTLLFTMSVPLLKNLIWDQDWTRVKQTRIGFDESTEGFRKQVMDTVQEIENSYWDLVAQEEQLRVAQKSVETAQALLKQVETQYEVGVVSRVDVTEAKAGLAQRQYDQIVAENLYRTVMDVLANRVLGRGLRPGSRLEIEPTDRPGDYVAYQIDTEAAVQKAFENRPELAAQRQEIERRVIETKYRNNQKLPELNVEGSFGYQGLAGKTNSAPSIFGGPRPPVTSVGRSYWSADDDFFQGNGSKIKTIKGILSIPLFNQAARHQATRAEIDLRRSRSRLAQIQQGIILEVRKAARDLQSAQEGIEASERARVAAEEQLRAERIRLEQGESTPFDVLQREENLVRAESGHINAIRVYRKSIVDLDRSQGTILKARNVVLDSDLTSMR